MDQIETLQCRLKLAERAAEREYDPSSNEDEVAIEHNIVYHSRRRKRVGKKRRRNCPKRVIDENLASNANGKLKQKLVSGTLEKLKQKRREARRIKKIESCHLQHVGPVGVVTELYTGMSIHTGQ